MQSRLGGLKVEDEVAIEEGPVMHATEAERLVENLRRFSLSDVGSEAWMAQHKVLERLNRQAHVSASEKSDEFVLEAMLTFQKMPVLVYDLILIEAWRERVLPDLCDSICCSGESLDARRRSCRTLRAYFVLYHEATIVNLLEVLCYHSHGLEACGDAALDLIDYCARRLATLQVRAEEFRDGSPESDTPEDDLRNYERDVAFAASCKCLALVRFVCQHIGDLSVSCVSRILETHDLLLSLVPLLENPPWARVKRQGDQRVWQKLDDERKWKDVPADRLLELTTLEAQVWLAIYYLTMHPDVRKRYGFDSFRKQSLLRVRRFLNDVALDQLPPLADLQRFMDHLAIVDAPEPTALERGHLVIEQVASLREAILKELPKASEAQRHIWRPGPRLDLDLADLVDVYAPEDGFDMSLPETLKDNMPAAPDDDTAPQEPTIVADGKVALPELMEGDKAQPVEDDPCAVESVAVAKGDELVVLDRVSDSIKVVDGPDGRDFDREKWTSDGLVVKNADIVGVTVTSKDGHDRRLELRLDLPCVNASMPLTCFTGLPATRRRPRPSGASSGTSLTTSPSRFSSCLSSASSCAATPRDSCLTAPELRRRLCPATTSATPSLPLRS